VSDQPRIVSASPISAEQAAAISSALVAAYEPLRQAIVQACEALGQCVICDPPAQRRQG
jgi:hypothetical protein